jgi:hypothetical protein
MRSPAVLAAACLSTVAAFVPISSLAQSVESDIPEQSKHLAKDATSYALPDVGTRHLESVNYQDAKDRFSIKFGLALLAGDYTSFEQDRPSYEQVGRQEDQFEARSRSAR